MSVGVHSAQLGFQPVFNFPLGCRLGAERVRADPRTAKKSRDNSDGAIARLTRTLCPLHGYRPEAARSAADSAAGVVQISGEDAAKMVIKHRLKMPSYELVQRILDEPDATVVDRGRFAPVSMIGGRLGTRSSRQHQVA